MQAQKPRSNWVRNGLIFGAILAALGLVNTAIQVAAGAYHVVASGASGIATVNVTNSGPTALLGCVLFIAMLALTFLACLLTARGTGKVGSGSLAGLVAGIIGSLLGSVISTIVLVILVAPGLQPPPGVSITTSQIQTLFATVTIGAAFLGLLLDAGLGAGMGAIGGVIGANSSPFRDNKALPPLPQAPMPYGPGYPNYPGYPANPNYPAGQTQPGPTPQP